MNEKINLQELIALLTKKSNITKKEAETFLKECLDTIHEALLEDRLIKVKNLGTFKLLRVNDRESVDVVTGERVLIPAHYKVNFSAENTLAQAINEPFSLFEAVELNEDDTIADSNGVITFSEAEDVLDDASDNEELTGNQEDNDNADFELVLDNFEKENENTILFTLDEENKISQTEEGDFNFILNGEMETEEKEEINDHSICHDDRKEITSDEPEIEKPNDLTFNLTLNLNEIVDPATPQVEIPEVIHDQEKIQIPQVPEEQAVQIEIPPMSEPVPQIEVPPVPVEPKAPQVPPVQSVPRWEKPPLPTAPAGERPPLPSTPIEESYKIYTPKKRRFRYPRWLIMPSYLAVLAGVAYGFYYLYNNMSDGEPHVPPVFTEAKEKTNDGANNDDTEQPKSKSNRNRNRNNLSDDSLRSILKKKYGEYLVGLQDDADSGNKTAENKPVNQPASSVQATQPSVPDRPISKNEKIITIQNGQTLTMLALTEYGNKCFWIYIYEENRHLLKNPDNVPAGIQLTMPSPEKYDIDKNSAASIRKAVERAGQILARH
jgi:nucleoid DNA-binding protein